MGSLRQLLGKRFGCWQVLKRAANDNGRVKWLCRCDCGTERAVASDHLIYETSKSCGSCKPTISQKHSAVNKENRRRDWKRWWVKNREKHLLKEKEKRGVIRKRMAEENEKIRPTDPLKKFCKTGHYAIKSEFNSNPKTKDNLATYCKTCQRQLDKDYYQKNKNKITLRVRVYEKTNQEKLTVRRREYYQKNKHKIIEHSRLWYQANKNRVKARSILYYSAHKDEITKRIQEYTKANRIKVNEYKKTHNHRRRTAKGRFTTRQWLDKCEYWNWSCYLCGVLLTRKAIHREHRIPIVRGGSNWIANIAPACKDCNKMKGTLTEREYRQFLSQFKCEDAAKNPTGSSGLTGSPFSFRTETRPSSS